MTAPVPVTIRPHYGRNSRPQGWYVLATGAGQVGHRFNTRRDARVWADANGYTWKDPR